jgi:hypothetical protein
LLTRATFSVAKGIQEWLARNQQASVDFQERRVDRLSDNREHCAQDAYFAEGCTLP